MKKAKLIKRTALAESNRHCGLLGKPLHHGRTQKTLIQWISAYQNSRCANPRAAFATLFASEA